MGLDGTIQLPESVGLVIIGRNEGERLQRSLERTAPVGPVVYVDSGSRDGSAEAARGLGFDVLELSEDRPFTAARARNEGFERLQDRHPGLDFVHFQDGDCLLDTVWLPAGREELVQYPEVALVAGVLREQDAQASAFNRLLDMEWQQPVGDDTLIGGNAMIRAEAFVAIGGFNEQLPAGEEGDLHMRLKERGGVVRRIDVPMAYHDASMTRFSQWWQRNVRAGQAVAEAVDLHAQAADRRDRRLARSNLFWGLAVPATGFLGAPWTLGASTLVPAVGYGALYAKIVRQRLADGWSLSDAELYARYTVMGKLPQALGQLKYKYLRAKGRETEVIDWRDAGQSDDD